MYKTFCRKPSDRLNSSAAPENSRKKVKLKYKFILIKFYIGAFSAVVSGIAYAVDTTYTTSGNYSLVDLSAIGAATGNINFVDTTSNMAFSNFVGSAVSCSAGISCKTSVGTQGTGIPFEILQAPSTSSIGALFLGGGTYISRSSWTQQSSYQGPPLPSGSPSSYTIGLSTPISGQKSFNILANTWWGSQQTANEFTIRVNFSDGSNQTFNSLSGTDVRDFNYNPTTSQTIANSTTNWYRNGSQWLDVRSLSLAPSNFGKSISSVTLTQQDAPYSAGFLAGFSFSSLALTPANDITVVFNNQYNMISNSSGVIVGRGSTLYNNFDNVMVDVSSKFDGGTLTNTPSAQSTTQNFTVTNRGGYINAASNRLGFSGQFTNDPGTLSAGKMIIQNLDNDSIDYSTHTGTRLTNRGTVAVSGDNSGFNGGFQVQAGANLEVADANALGTGSINLVGSSTVPATLSTTSSILISNGITVEGDPVFNIRPGTTTTISSIIADGNTTGSIVSGDVVVSGGGTLLLTNANTYSGQTTVDNGSTLTLSGSGSITPSSLVTNNGTFNIQPKTNDVSLSGNYVQSNSGLLKMGLTASNNPKLLVTGTASLAGSLNVLAASGAYRAGRYNLITASQGVTGTFGNTYISPLPLAYTLGYDANNVYLDLLPVSIQTTQQSVQINANGLTSIINQQVATYQLALSYDCEVYDKNNICVSAGGRYTYAGPSPSVNAQAGVIIIGHRPAPTFRYGAFADQTINISAPSGFSQNKNSPMWGLFANWNRNGSGNGLGIYASAVFSTSNLSITRSQLQNSEAGTGTSSFGGEGYQLKASYRQPIADSTAIIPYLGMRYTRVGTSAYTENNSVSVNYPLSYNSTSQNTFSALVGIGLNSLLSEKITGIASLGIQQNLNYSMSSYQGTSQIPGYQIFYASMPNSRNSLATATAGLLYDINKRERLGLNILWQQQPYVGTSTTSAIATYTVGF